MTGQKFYICKHCGNLVGMIRASGVPIICCGEPMSELIPGTVDASLEKHVPVVSVNGNLVEVNVGAVDHPMVPEHFIEWVYLETNLGGQRKNLKPGDKPHVTFALAPGEEPITAFEYCNLHSLWKKDI